MNATDMLHRIGDALGSTATVKSVFGEPIQADGKTIVPVARVAYGFGGGSGTGRNRAHGRRRGEGGGGGVRACPAGALEITEDATRFIPFVDRQRLLAALTAGLGLVALILARRRK